EPELSPDQPAHHRVAHLGLLLHLDPGADHARPAPFGEDDLLTRRGRAAGGAHRDVHDCIGPRMSRSLSSRVCRRLTGSSTGGELLSPRRHTTRPEPTLRIPVTSGNATR